MLTRRGFMEGVVSAILIYQIFNLEDSLSTDKNKIKSKGDSWLNEKVIRASRVIKNENKRQEFLITALQSILLFSVEAILFYLKDKLGIKKDGMLDRETLVLLEQELVKEHNQELFQQIIRQPFFETIFLQYIPSILSELTFGKGLNWQIGLPVTVLFALLHNVGKDEDGKIKFDTEFIPWTQFLQGLFYWYLIRTAGPVSTMLAHSTHNLVNVLDLTFDIYPKHRK